MTQPDNHRGCASRTFGFAPRTFGFTLIELMVVISITALLISILLPVLGSARESGRGVKCLSNLRQMGIVLASYQHDERGSFPVAYWFGGGNSYSWEINTIGGVHELGILWSGQGTLAIQQCPSYDGPDNWTSSPYSGYNYNTSFLGHGQFEAIPEPAAIDQVLSPTRCVVFGDGGYAGGANKFMRSPLVNPGDTTNASTRAAGTQAFRHSRATNAVYADGHGQVQRERYTAGNPSVVAGAGFLSDDNSAYDLE